MYFMYRIPEFLSSIFFFTNSPQSPDPLSPPPRTLAGPSAHIVSLSPFPSPFMGEGCSQGHFIIVKIDQTKGEKGDFL